MTILFYQSPRLCLLVLIFGSLASLSERIIASNLFERAYVHSISKSRKSFIQPLGLKGGVEDSHVLAQSLSPLQTQFSRVQLVAWRALTTSALFSDTDVDFTYSKEASQRVVFEVEIDYSTSEFTVSPGDCFGVRCSNSVHEVNNLLSAMGCDSEATSSILRSELTWDREIGSSTRCRVTFFCLFVLIGCLYPLRSL